MAPLNYSGGQDCGSDLDLTGEEHLGLRLRNAAVSSGQRSGPLVIRDPAIDGGQPPAGDEGKEHGLDLITGQPARMARVPWMSWRSLICLLAVANDTVGGID